MINILPANIC